ncbi:efflux RND transporter permease subunit [Dactylosporangium cerinum]
MEAYPEFTPPRVEVQTEALGLSAEEVEQLITNPMEQEFFNGLPWLSRIRSNSFPGLSSIELIFEPGTDIIQARQVVQERLTMTAALPQVASKPPFVVQSLSSTSRLMMIGLSSKDLSLIDMSVLARWKVKPRLMGVPGVANVAVFGLRDRQLQVLVDPAQLSRHQVTLDQVVRTTGNALWVSPLTFVEASTPGTGGFVDTPNQRIEVQHTSPIKTAQDLAQVTVQDAQSPSVRLGDVAQIVEDHQPLIGDAGIKGGSNLILVVERFPGTNVAAVTRDVEDALQAMRPGLTGVDIDTTVFRQATFLEQALGNLTRTAVLGIVVLLLIAGALLFDWRAAVIGIVAILSSVAATVLVLTAFDLTVNLMMLAGLVMAVAVVVDDAIVDLYAIRRRHGDQPLTATVVAAAAETRGPLLVATAIIAASVVPFLAIGGVTGAFLRPVTFAYLLAVLASMVVALTVTPALTMVLLAKRVLPPRESPVARVLERWYAAVLGRLVRRPVLSYVMVGLVLLAGLAILPQLRGLPLTPPLKDRHLLVHWTAAPGTSLPEMNRMTAQAGNELRTVPGVRAVGSHVGRASTSEQLNAINAAEFWITVDPAANYDTTVRLIRAVVEGYPGFDSAVSAYPDQRVQEVNTGTDRPLVVRVYGNDYTVLRAKADEVTRILSGVDGVVAPHASVPTTEPTMEIEVFIAAAARHGIKPGDVRRAAATYVSGTTAGSLFEEQKVFDVVVWGTPDTRRSLTSVRELMLDTPTGGQVRLGDVADVAIRPNPSVIKHDEVSRYVDVVADVRGRDLGAVTRDAERRLRSVTFPREHHLEVLGDATARQDAQRLGLMYTIGVAIAIFFILQACFGSWRLASVVFLLLLLVAFAGAVYVAVAQGARRRRCRCLASSRCWRSSHDMPSCRSDTTRNSHDRPAGSTRTSSCAGHGTASRRP